MGVDVGVEVAVLVNVAVGGVIVPVGVKVAVEVAVPVDVLVAVGVRDGVGVAVGACAWLRKTTIVCDAAYPCTMVTVTLRALMFLLIKRFAGMVYMSVTEYPACATSVIVRVPASTVRRAEHAPTGTVTVLVPYLKVK